MILRAARFGESGGCPRQQATQFIRALTARHPGEREIVLGLRREQGRQSLGVDEIHASVAHGAPGEFAGLRWPGTEIHQSLLQRTHEGQPTMRRDLHQVLAGVRVRAFEKRREHLVERFSVGIGERRQVEPPDLHIGRQRRQTATRNGKRLGP
jgi:hypothetical protein